MSRSAPNSIATIDQFINSVGSVKTASDGSTPKSEPGSIGGETTHPVKKVDDRLKEVKTGERFSENTKDVNEDQGAVGVQKAPEASTKSAASIFGVAAGFAKKAEGGAVSTPGSAADDHKAVTTTVSATGEDPSNETNSAKAGKEDKEQGGMGGTKHPASTENDQLDGHKYASDTPLEKLASDMKKIGDNLLANLHHAYTNQGVQPPQQTKQAAAAQPQQHQTINDPNLAYFAGHELAGLISGNFDKRAADEMVHNTLTGVIKQASDDADLFITYASNFLKRAEGEEEAGGGGGEEAAGGGDPMAAMGGGAEAGGGGGGGGGEEEMLAALGGGAGGGDPSGGMGGGGGDPMGGGGGGGDEAAQLAQILEQLGVTPEELEQALQQQGMGGGGGGGGDPMGGAGGGGDPMAAMGGMGGGGGGAPPGGGGAPPMPGMETQANAGGGKRNVGNNVKQAEVRNYIQEIVSRSRARR